MKAFDRCFIEAKLAEGRAQGHERTAAYYDGRVRHALRFGATEAEVWARGKARKARRQAGYAREKAVAWRIKAERADREALKARQKRG